uniref:Uncharacterized protein n=1 Tax=Anguilla anguilla TaxID=7936 RepID=A0A0E9P8B0_ANGAN
MVSPDILECLLYIHMQLYCRVNVTFEEQVYCSSLVMTLNQKFHVTN